MKIYTYKSTEQINTFFELFLGVREKDFGQRNWYLAFRIMILGYGIGLFLKKVERPL